MPLCRSVLVLSPIGSISLSYNGIKWNIIDKMLGLFQTPARDGSANLVSMSANDWIEKQHNHTGRAKASSGWMDQPAKPPAEIRFCVVDSQAESSAPEWLR